MAGCDIDKFAKTTHLQSVMQRNFCSFSPPLPSPACTRSATTRSSAATSSFATASTRATQGFQSGPSAAAAPHDLHVGAAHRRHAMASPSGTHSARTSCHRRTRGLPAWTSHRRYHEPSVLHCARELRRERASSTPRAGEQPPPQVSTVGGPPPSPRSSAARPR